MFGPMLGAFPFDEQSLRASLGVWGIMCQTKVFNIDCFHDPIIHLVYPPKILHKHCF